MAVRFLGEPLWTLARRIGIGGVLSALELVDVCSLSPSSRMTLARLRGKVGASVVLRESNLLSAGRVDCWTLPRRVGYEGRTDDSWLQH